MRILVLGATGYVGSRLVPALLEAGHEVVAASSSAADPARFAWGDRVTWRQCDVTDEAAVERAVRDAEGICYLVHALRHRGFSELDRVGATHVRDAASVGRRTPPGLPVRTRTRASSAARPSPSTSRPGWRSSRSWSRPTARR